MPHPLSKKLRLTVGQSITVLNRPGKEYFSDYEVSEEIPKAPEAVIILFVKDLAQLKEETVHLVRSDLLVPGGRLLIAYPKKGNHIMDSYIHRDDIFPALGVGEDGYLPDSDYKFNQMVSLDQDYTIVGIKHEKRGKAKKAASQCLGARLNDDNKAQQEEYRCR